jgi:hypothetical protein
MSCGVELEVVVAALAPVPMPAAVAAAPHFLLLPQALLPLS